MSQQELLRKVIQALDSAGIEYIASGSEVCRSHQGWGAGLSYPSTKSI